MFSVTHVVTFSITQWVTFSITQWVTFSITPRTTHDLQMKKRLGSPTTYERPDTCGQPGSEVLEPSNDPGARGVGERLRRAKTTDRARARVSPSGCQASPSVDRPRARGARVAARSTSSQSHGSSSMRADHTFRSTCIREVSTHDLSSVGFFPPDRRLERPRSARLSPRGPRRNLERPGVSTPHHVDTRSHPRRPSRTGRANRCPLARRALPCSCVLTAALVCIVDPGTGQTSRAFVPAGSSVRGVSPLAQATGTSRRDLARGNAAVIEPPGVEPWEHTYRPPSNGEYV
jgi:hypothetical protein